MENGYRWNEEFQEEDMWGVVVKEREDSDSDSDCGRRRNRNRPKSSKNVQECRMSSAPVNIPDWSKIYGTNPKKWEVDSSWDSDNEEEEGGINVNVMPPHQVIARKQLSSFSVFEGAGRTLKGRDLSRVRNAVLTKTGFLESKSHQNLSLPSSVRPSYLQQNITNLSNTVSRK